MDLALKEGMFHSFSSLLVTALVLPLVLLSGCSQPEPEESCGFEQNSLGRRISWQKFPVTFYLSADASSEVVYSMDEAAHIWNQAFGFEAIRIDRTDFVFEAPSFVGGESNSPERWVPPTDGFNVIYFSDSSRGFEGEEVTSPSTGQLVFTEAQARTHLSFQGDYIHEADIVINGGVDYSLTSSSVSQTPGTVDFVSLGVHELGHGIGLAHVDFDPMFPNVMNPLLGNNTLRRSINDMTIDSLRCEYDL